LSGICYLFSLPHVFLNPARKSANCYSGAGGGGAGNASASPKVLICQILAKSLKIWAKPLKIWVKSLKIWG